MAIFGKKQNTTEKKKTAAPAVASAQTASAAVKKHAGAILHAPRITEKSAIATERNVYVFNVAKSASKREIIEAVHALFKVMPTKVRVTQIKGKVRISRATNRVGKSASGKKAYVHLKKGDKIELA